MLNFRAMKMPECRWRVDPCTSPTIKA